MTRRINNAAKGPKRYYRPPRTHETDKWKSEGKKDTQEFRSKFIKLYSKELYDIGVLSAAQNNGFGGSSDLESGDKSIITLREGIYNQGYHYSAINAVISFIEKRRVNKADCGYGKLDEWIDRNEYRSVESGWQPIKEWQYFKRLELLELALDNIKPSNSAKSLVPFIKTSPNYNECGLIDSEAPHVNMHGWGRGEYPYISLCLQSTWLTGWACSQRMQSYAPDRHMILAEDRQPDLAGRACAKVKYVKSMPGSKYTGGEGYVAVWQDKFIMAKTRRSLENAYRRAISAAIIEDKYKDVTNAAKEEHGDKLDSITKKSLQSAVLAEASSVYEKGLIYLPL